MYDYLDKNGLKTLLGLIKDKIPVNPNLLINPDFKINQRGVSGLFSKTGKYFVDRWRLVQGSVTVNADKTLTLNGMIEQELENDVGTNVVFYSDGGLPAYDSSKKTFNIIGSNATIGWTKLEYGNMRTVFIPPDPATELLKCQRYYQICRETSTCRTFSADTGCYFSFGLKTEMRTKPTIIPPNFSITDELCGTATVGRSVAGWRLGDFSTANSRDVFQFVIKNSDTSVYNTDLWYKGYNFPIALDAEIY